MGAVSANDFAQTKQIFSILYVRVKLELMRVLNFSFDKAIAIFFILQNLFQNWHHFCIFCIKNGVITQITFFMQMKANLDA